jgi:LEA14-like dessication related protein
MGKKNKKGGGLSSRTIGFILIAGAAYYLYNAYQNVMRVMVGGASFRVHKVTLTNIELRVFLTIINQGNFNLNVQNFLGQVYYKNTSIGIVRLLNQTTVKPFDTTQIEFKADLSLLSLGTEVFNIIKSNTNIKDLNASDLTIRGTLKAEGIDIPINEKLLTA